jgi:mRNA interferase RelE/StbE
MSFAISWSERATFAASRYLADDAAGLAELLQATDQLATEPRPAESFPYGSDHLRRTRVGRYRILYEIYPDDQVIMILHVGRVA